MPVWMFVYPNRENGKGKAKSANRETAIFARRFTCHHFQKSGTTKKTEQFYERLKEKKGIGMVAVVAVARKLLGLMYSLWKKEEMYKENVFEG